MNQLARHRVGELAARVRSAEDRPEAIHCAKGALGESHVPLGALGGGGGARRLGGALGTRGGSGPGRRRDRVRVRIRRRRRRLTEAVAFGGFRVKVFPELRLVRALPPREIVRVEEQKGKLGGEVAQEPLGHAPHLLAQLCGEFPVVVRLVSNHPQEISNLVPLIPSISTEVLQNVGVELRHPVPAERARRPALELHQQHVPAVFAILELHAIGHVV